MIAASMPPGVEHQLKTGDLTSTFDVIAASMPPGVEHFLSLSDDAVVVR